MNGRKVNSPEHGFITVTTERHSTMTPSTSLIETVLVVICVTFLIPAVTCDKLTFDLTVRYFSDVSMICDHPDLQISQQNDVRSLSWLLPDGAVIDSSRKLDPKRFHLSGINDSLDAYNLTVMDVSDDVFGYYTCIVVYDSQTKPLDTIRWGLNVGGADFSELMQTYEDNAIVGGIAAAAMLVALGVVCLLWYLRYGNRHTALLADLEQKLNDGDVQELSASGCHNQSYLSEQEMTEVKPDPGAGGNSVRVKM